MGYCISESAVPNSSALMIGMIRGNDLVIQDRGGNASPICRDETHPTVLYDAAEIETYGIALLSDRETEGEIVVGVTFQPLTCNIAFILVRIGNSYLTEIFRSSPGSRET